MDLSVKQTIKHAGRLRSALWIYKFTKCWTYRFTDCNLRLELHVELSRLQVHYLCYWSPGAPPVATTVHQTYKLQTYTVLQGSTRPGWYLSSSSTETTAKHQISRRHNIHRIISTLKHTGPYRATQGPQLLRNWSVMGDRGGGATSTGQCRLHQIKACQSSDRRTPSAAEMILLQFQTWLLTCEIKH